MSSTGSAIGIDIGGTKTVVAVVGWSGQIQSRVEYATNSIRGFVTCVAGVPAAPCSHRRPPFVNTTRPSLSSTPCRRSSATEKAVTIPSITAMPRASSAARCSLVSECECEKKTMSSDHCRRS